MPTVRIEIVSEQAEDIVLRCRAVPPTILKFQERLQKKAERSSGKCS